jgi:hypothetical protein
MEEFPNFVHAEVWVLDMIGDVEWGDCRARRVQVHVPAAMTPQIVYVLLLFLAFRCLSFRNVIHRLRESGRGWEF